ncbi:RNA polymerase-associated protein RapA [Thiorhodovibrio winogradskyi]|uniref:RNA polymerase-associated protein RapA n=1 Tax=Thiorhodovibrio winogradskyi TaxID=77007 RepID=A0ABZ0S551_9GAMM|nr:DEAD/DEAH box helicase [Thiorhodovibrio winogradskyi]
MDAAVALNTDDVVVHEDLGRGTVIVDRGATAVVRFDERLEECEKSSLRPGPQIDKDIRQGHWSPAIDAITYFQAAAILSVNDQWGVFSRSQIALLPHQLWVCHQVLRQWPARQLIADDVGLGKTIEAGLILWPLISKKLTQRILILCPAGLVDQWQFRLRTMFDIRLTPYMSAADTPKADYWNGNNQVVASLPTLRQDNNGRHDRLLSAEPWDLLIVDEAHHLNADEHQGATLGYALIRKLMEHGKIQSALFFTGTPHRGKPYNFWALLHLLRPDLFDPDRPDAEQIPHLRDILIRNNKQSVVDMQGRKLFKPIHQYPTTYRYNDAERDFYSNLTSFIASGRAYASTLSKHEGKQVMLVLIAMQKLASSSVAAIRKALKGRLARLTREKERLQTLLAEEQARLAQSSKLVSAEDDADLLDLQQALDELSVEDTAASIQLLANEIPHLRTLVDAADAVADETKVERIMEVMQSDFADRQVLFFTEYKATQSLLMSALIRQYGEGCVTFINGDEHIEGVIDTSGRPQSMSVPRETAAEQFNAGQIRFLVSTEAGGEGIDLQHRCHTLIHVDLPWNPMRLHQRVGRLHRYGQKYPVDVVSVRNEETVEALIWDKLNAKLGHIMQALGSAMDEPEDLLQLVLGMTDKSLFTELFSQANSVPRERLADWFDEKTKTFGGSAALDTVKALVGNVAKFDCQGLKEIPTLDLPDLRAFFEAMLVKNQRRLSWSEDRLSFKTPDVWLTSPAVNRHYKNVVFSRERSVGEADAQVIGVGHAAFNNAIAQALEQEAVLAKIDGLEHPLVIAKVIDRVTLSSGTLRSRIFGVVVPLEGASPEVVTDDELLRILNQTRFREKTLASPVAIDKSILEQTYNLGVERLRLSLTTLGLPFKHPEHQPLGLLWPAS